MNKKAEPVQQEKRGSVSLALKSGFWYIVSTFVTKGLAFITTPIFARLMSTSDYGEFINFANWLNLLIIIFSVEMYGTLNRAYYDYKEEFNEYASTVTIATIVVTILGYFIFLKNEAWIFSIVSIPKEYIHLMFFVLVFQGCRLVFLAKERTLYRYRKVTLISMISLVIPTVISIVGVFLVQETERLSARMYGFYVPFAIIGAYCAYVLIGDGKAFKWKYLKYAIVFAIPLWVHYFTTYLLSSTNVIITKNVLGAQEAAVVSIVMSIMSIITILFQSITGAATTWIMDNLEIKNYSKVKTCIITMSIGVAIVALLIMILAPEIVVIIGGKKYYGATSLMPGMTLSIFLQILASIFAIILTYDKNVVKTAIITGVIALVSIVIKLVLLPLYGCAILPWINTIAFFGMFVGNYILVKRAGYIDCIDFKILFAIITIVLVFAIISGWLYQGVVIRYIICGFIIGGILVLILKNKVLLLEIIKKDK